MKYIKRDNKPIVAVQLDLDCSPLTFNKWGATQVANQGDWLVNNNDEVYTVEQQSFAETYGPCPTGTVGHYIKTAVVEAEQMSEAGSVDTKEGTSHYSAGDYLVTNGPGDQYSVSQANFEEMYVEVT